MKLASFEAIVTALNTAGVRFLVVGGVAVNAHGFLRYTKDVDLVVRLTPEDIMAAFRALEGIDYYPAVPITAEQFANPAMREDWRNEKGMLVLKFWSNTHPETPLDVFIYEPFDFPTAADRAFRPDEAGAPQVGFASIAELIAMKRAAGRPLDFVDIEKLEKIAELRSRDSGA
jgi:hypothetical protein